MERFRNLLKTCAYHVVRRVLWLIFRVGFGLDVRGQHHLPRRGAFVLASNHVSFLDPPVLGAACPRRLTFMARADLFRHGALGVFMRTMRVIPLHRGEADPRAIREALGRLRRGGAVAVFPEGGRQPSGRLGAAKRGVGLLAIAAGVPIVPVVVRGTFEAWPPHARAPRRVKIRVAFGEPIAYTDRSSSAPRSGGLRAGAGGPQASRPHQEQLAEAVTRQWRRLFIDIETP